VFNHTEKRITAYRPQQLFDMVADVEAYPLFLPWCVDVTMLSRQDDSFVASVSAGHKHIRYRFTSHDTLYRPHNDNDGAWRIRAVSHDGPFRSLHNEWVFQPHAKGCALAFTIRFEFASPMATMLFKPLFSRVAYSMVEAFEKRARHLYG